MILCTLTSRLEGLVKEYRQTLNTSEMERKTASAKKENRPLRLTPPRSTTSHMTSSPSHMTYTPGHMTSPPTSPLPDTPSKDVVLEPEPHGAEFEVSRMGILL